MITIGYEKKEDLINDEEMTYAGRRVLLDKIALQLLKERMLENNPFAIVRLGETENRVIFYEEETDFPVQGIIKKRRVYKEKFYNLCEGAGFFPKNINLIPQFSEVICNAMVNIDFFAINAWNGEERFAERYCSSSVLIKNSAINYFFWQEEPWTQWLEGKKVLVISPFAKTIERQYAFREEIWGNTKMLPLFSLKTYKPVQQFRELNEINYESWFSALDAMSEDIDKFDFDIAILGCGAYGIPLASRIRKRGRSAIQLSGNTQLLFGIKGKRWENDKRINCFYNDFWVHPNKEEIPKRKEIVEGGCYW